MHVGAHSNGVPDSPQGSATRADFPLHAVAALDAGQLRALKCALGSIILWAAGAVLWRFMRLRHFYVAVLCAVAGAAATRTAWRRSLGSRVGQLVALSSLALMLFLGLAPAMIKAAAPEGLVIGMAVLPTAVLSAGIVCHARRARR